MRNPVMAAVRAFGTLLVRAMRDIAPIIAIIAFFQIVILRQPFPHLQDVVVGLGLVTLGLTLFVQGLELGLFPVGETLAKAFAGKGSIFMLFLFAFCLGFGSTAAEPALIAVTNEAARVAAAAKYIDSLPQTLTQYADGLRYTVAVAVGAAAVLGVWRILMGWPPHWFIVAGYVVVLVLTFFAPPEIVGVAYDSGGVATSTVSVPLLTALGVGLASSIGGRSPLADGFGLIALACLMPMIFVMLYAIIP